MASFEEFKSEIERISDTGDQEQSHIEADELLIEVALNTELTYEQRRIIVSIYRKIDKWYA